MAIFPLLPLIGILVGLVSLVLLGFGVFWIVGWVLGIGITLTLFVIGLAIVAFMLLGRFVVLLVAGRSGEDEPNSARSTESQSILRPDGTALNVEFYGPPDAPPIILTHGWTANSTDWYYLKRHLANQFRVVVWDLPGSSRSSLAKDGNYRLERMAGDLAAVVELVGRPAIVVGHSMGGMIALNFCKLFPQLLEQQVAGLVLMDTTYINPTRTAPASGFLTAIQKPILSPLMYLMIGLWPVVWLQNWLSFFNGTAHIQQRFGSFCGSQTRGQLDHMAYLQTITPPWVIGKQMLAMFKHNTTETLPRINVPTLIIVGDNDRGCVPQASHFMHSQIPGSQLVEITHSGHVSMMEQPTQVLAALGEFANRVSRSETKTKQRSL